MRGRVRSLHYERGTEVAAGMAGAAVAGAGGAMGFGVSDGIGAELAGAGAGEARAVLLSTEAEACFVLDAGVAGRGEACNTDNCNNSAFNKPVCAPAGSTCSRWDEWRLIGQSWQATTIE